MPSYEELKAELVEISSILERFPQEVRPQVYELLVSEFLGRSTGSGASPKKPKESKSKQAPKPKQETACGTTPSRRKPRVSRESYSIDRDLALTGDESTPSFKQFVDEKRPRSSAEFNAVAVYYLKKLLGIGQATLDHAYTCYAEVNRKPPENFRQSFIDTKNKKGWVEFDDSGNLDIPHRGVVFVEHDLPHSKGEGK